MKQLIIISITLLISMASYGQNDYQAQFDTFRQETRKQYEVYSDSINNAFVEFIKENWVKFKISDPIPVPKKPLPQMDVSTSQEDSSTFVELTVDSIIQQKDFSEELNLLDSQNQNNENGRKTTIFYYGSELQFHYFPEFSFSVINLEEKTIATIWKQLSHSPYKELINELLFYKNDMNLNDWGMYQLLNQVMEKFYPEKKNNQIIFSTFLMNQLGFRIKIGRCDNKLISLISFQTTVYGIPFINFKDERYYIFGKTNTNNGIYSYPIDYPNTDKRINLQAQRPFRFALSLYTKQCKVGEKTYSININKNLIDLFRTYPQTEISVYANTPISTITRKSLEKEVLPQLSNKTEQESVNFLLQFVQTAFEYKNDLQQFGQEKFFFAEELFYYPFSDCEDRSVLFSQLVRRFLGLQVILLDYPDHVTTAVKFNTPVAGDYVDIQGNKYIICDPTYLHAKVGQSIPRYKKQKAKIYILD